MKVADAPLYRCVADRILTLVESGTYTPGDRLPSIRELSRQMRVSVNTVKTAYDVLEADRVVEPRPQSGYYVRRLLPEIPAEPPIERRASVRLLLVVPRGEHHVEGEE